MDTKTIGKNGEVFRFEKQIFPFNHDYAVYSIGLCEHIGIARRTHSKRKWEIVDARLNVVGAAPSRLAAADALMGMYMGMAGI